MESNFLRVLVVDDEVDMLSIVSNVLTSGLGSGETALAVQTAETAANARRLIIRSDFDLVLLDVKMPGVAGLELMHFALEQVPTAALVLMTAYPDYEDAVTAIKEGAFDYIVKPFTADQVIDVAKRAFTDRLLWNGQPRNPKEIERPLDAVLGEHPRIRKLRRLIAKVSGLNEIVLLLGETGTGKGLTARVLHESGPYRGRPLMTLDCGAIPTELMESELFGHEKGSFTGADRARKGLLELAADGTLFLDEISDLPLQLQSRLLRALQEREFRRVGGSTVKSVSARIIVASNRDLRELVKEGKFREDLYYRVNVIPVTIPPLRERAEDILQLAEAFLSDFRGRNPKAPVRSLGEEAVDCLMHYSWPGNVRELENVIRRTCALSTSSEIRRSDLPHHLLTASKSPDSDALGEFNLARDQWLSQFEDHYFRDLLGQTAGNVVEAARLSGVPRATLYRYLRKYELDPARFRSSNSD